MTEQLIQTVEASAEEEIREIQKQAASRAIRIQEEARREGEKIKQQHMGHWKNAIALERSSIVAAEVQARLKILTMKEEIVYRAFEMAADEISRFRGDDRYAAFVETSIREVLDEMQGRRFNLHVDRRDLPLYQQTATRMGLDLDLIPDGEGFSGVRAETPDGSIIINNTLESRLERSQEVLRSAIFRVLDGD